MYEMTYREWFVWQEKKKAKEVGGAWVAQLVEHHTSAQVMILWFMSSSPTSGWLLSVQSTSDPLSPSFSVLPSTLSKISKH